MVELNEIHSKAPAADEMLEIHPDTLDIIRERVEALGFWLYCHKPEVSKSAHDWAFKLIGDIAASLRDIVIPAVESDPELCRFSGERADRCDCPECAFAREMVRADAIYDERRDREGA